MPSLLRRLSLTFFVIATLSACQSRHAASTSGNDATLTFSPTDYPLVLDYDAALPRVDGDASGYFDNGGWQVADGAPGEHLLLLKLPKSDEITTGLWRLGASRNANAVTACLSLPDNAQTLPETTTIGGRPVQGFTTGDAGMSHFQTIQGYRAVIDDTCYAIDLIVEGTNGEVYDPPREPPFARDDAMQRLQQINDGLTWQQ